MCVNNRVDCGMRVASGVRISLLLFQVVVVPHVGVLGSVCCWGEEGVGGFYGRLVFMRVSKILFGNMV